MAKRILRSQRLEEQAVGLAAAVEAGEAEELVRGVELLVVEGEAEADGVDAQVLLEEPAEGAAAADADVGGRAAVELRQDLARGEVAGVVRRDQVGAGGAGKLADSDP